MSALRKISSHFVWTPQGFLRSPILSFDPSGRVVEITTAECVDREAGVEFFSGLLIPGLVNAHCHSELSYLRGKIARGTGFAGFASAISQVRHEASPQERLSAATYWDAKMYRDGVSVVGDICNSATTFALKEQSAIRYHNFIEYFGLLTTDFSPTEQLFAAAQHTGIASSETPHSTYSLQDAPFRAISARSNRLSIHFMESRAESELFAGFGPLAQRNQLLGVSIDFAHYGSPAQRVCSSVPSNRPTLLIHNTFADSATIEQLETHFTTPPTWVLCPRSNNYIEGAHPPAALLHQKGVRIAIGTDSLASNESLSMIEELKMLPEIPLETRLRWATLQGAEALGMGDLFGSFEIGKQPGAVLISGIDWQTEQLSSQASSRRIL